MLYIITFHISLSKFSENQTIFHVKENIYAIFFFANTLYYLNLKKRECAQWDTHRRVHGDTPSRRAPNMLNVNKTLDVYPAGFHLKFIYI